MNKKLIVLTLLVLSGIFQAAQAQKLFGIGIQAGAGANYATVNEQVATSGTASVSDVGTKFAPNFGVFLDINPPLIDNAIIHTALGFRQRGFLAQKPATSIAGTAAIADYAVNNSYLHADAVLRAKLNLRGPVKPYLGVGIRADVRLATSVSITTDIADKGNIESRLQADFKDGYKAATLSAVIQAGIAVSIVNVELEWNPDLTRALNGKIAGSDFNSTNSVINLNVGLRLFGW